MVKPMEDWIHLQAGQDMTESDRAVSVMLSSELQKIDSINSYDSWLSGWKKTVICVGAKKEDVYESIYRKLHTGKLT